MKKSLLVGLLAIVFCFVLVGCGKKNTIVGSWKSKDYGDTYVYTFNEDGTGNYLVAGSKMEFTYKIDGNKISITYNDSQSTFDSEYSIENNELDIIDSLGRDTYYTRK